MVTDEVGYRQATTLAQTAPRSTAAKITYVTLTASFVFILFTDYGQAYRDFLGQLWGAGLLGEALEPVPGGDPGDLGPLQLFADPDEHPPVRELGGLP